MASSSSDKVPIQVESSTEYMDSDVYWEAEKHHIGPAIRRNAQRLAQLQTPDGNTVLHVCITSAEALAHENNEETLCCEIIESLLEMCSELLMKPNKKKETPLHLAARYGHEGVVTLLIERAKARYNEDFARQMLRMESEEKDTALHEAARFNHLGVVALLTNEDPHHYMYPANKAGEIPLFVAVERGYSEVVLEIIRKCSSLTPPNADPHGRTVLHAAAIVGDHVEEMNICKHADQLYHVEMTGEILEKWREFSKVTDKQGWTALHYAAEGKWASTVKKLLEFDKSAAYIQDKQGRIALHIAAWNGHEKIMKKIILQCPDCCELVDNRGRNVLHFAVKSNNLEAMQVIINQRSLSYLLNATDSEGNTPFHLIPASRDLVQDAFLRQGRLDKLALLKRKNQNAVDVALTNQNISALEKEKFFKERLRRQLREANGTKTSIDKNTTDDESSAIDSMDKLRDSTLVAATLIATVTFAAAFTMPGGYVSSDGSNTHKSGTAILAKKAAFRAFIITDTIAMLLSSGAVFSVIAGVLLLNMQSKLSLYVLAVNLTWYAMVLVTIAFATGTYAVLEKANKGMAIAVCALVVFSTAILYCFHTFTVMHQQWGRPKKKAKNDLADAV